MSNTYAVTMTLTSTTDNPSAQMTVDWGTPLREVIEEVGGPDNLPASYQLMITIIDRIMALNTAFNEDMSLSIVEPEETELEDSTVRH